MHLASTLTRYMGIERGRVNRILLVSETFIQGMITQNLFEIKQNFHPLKFF